MCTALKEWEADIRNDVEEQMTVRFQEVEERIRQAEERIRQAEKRASQAEDRAEGYRAILLLHGIDPDESVKKNT